MSTKKRSSKNRIPLRLGTAAGVLPGMKALANEMAARYRAGQEPKVRDALAPFGSLETYPLGRMIVLRQGPGVVKGTVHTVLDGLQRAKLIEFVTPVLVDRQSNARQVLTDEIVLRLKPGRGQRTLAALAAEHGVRIGRRNEFEPSQYIVKVPKPSGTQTLDVARSLDRSEDVEFASPNFLTEIKR